MNRSENSQVKRKGANGLGVVYRGLPVANKEFTGVVGGVDRLIGPRSGWDPYEVWRTRVKGSVR